MAGEALHKSGGCEHMLCHSTGSPRFRQTERHTTDDAQRSRW